MENNKKLKTIIVVLLILVIGLFGFIIYDKVLSDNGSDDNLGQTKDDKSTIVTKRYDSLSCENFDVSLNGIDVKIVSDDNDAVCNSTMYVNNEEIDIQNLWISSIQIVDKMILMETGNTSSKTFQIYNTLKGDFEDILLPEGSYESFGYNNNVISLKYKYSMQSSSPVYYDKFLEQLSCEQLDSIKNDVFVEWVYQMEYYGDGKISNMNIAEKTKLSDSKIYQDLLDSCKE